MNEAAINVKLEDQHLHISLKTEQSRDEADANGGHYRYRERFVGELQRVLSIPGPVDASKMKTQYHNGVLAVTIPKA
ncbi:MAG: Hsp20/alpha crystallin family protein [Methylovulum sp.]|nr:Hsp20/alpha crystallin family protein [Methylovulum sp.]